MSVSKKELFQVSSYSRKLRDNVKSILDNYSEILKASKVDDQTQRVTEAQVAHVENEIAVRSANIVRAAVALSKLVSDLKENLILNDFSSINEITSRITAHLQKLVAIQNKELLDVYSSLGNSGTGEPATPTDQT